MRIDDLMLEEAFEVKGHWWLPDNPQEKFYGTFQYDKNKATLELIGTFENAGFAMMSSTEENDSRHPCLHGTAADGEKVSLFYPSIGSQRVGRTVTTSYDVMYMLLGSHAKPPDILRIKSMSIRLNHLDEFIGAKVFGNEDDGGEDKFTGMTVRYVQPESVSFRIESAATSVTFGIGLSYSPGRMKFEMHARSDVRFVPDSPQSMEASIRTIWRFCYLMTLLTNESISPKCVAVTVEGESFPSWLLYRQVRRIPESDMSNPTLLLYLSDVNDQFSAVLDKWFSVGDMLLDGIHLFMDAQRSAHSSVEPRFLLLAQALEVVSRATMNAEYMSAEEYKPIARALREAIPTNVSDDHKASLRTRLGFLYEYSLGKRVTSMLQSLTEESQRVVCNHTKNFAKGVSDCRNYLTHYTDELRLASLHGGDIYWMSEKLALLLRIALLKYLGVNEKTIVKEMTEHPYLSQTITLAKKHKEFVAPRAE